MESIDELETKIKNLQLKPKHKKKNSSSDATQSPHSPNSGNQQPQSKNSKVKTPSRSTESTPSKHQFGSGKKNFTPEGSKYKRWDTPPFKSKSPLQEWLSL
eukprot:TRINITY_DN17502_c0_g1_i1.p1 TRINITY_DN17502_c0_g1~~TRINITY_DN17502_c0_g1_i1.p1  ORF type:complete len:101 (-),score=14.74 TRINITY_DN17502_c0_g1_i1:148-450(-)